MAKKQNKSLTEKGFFELSYEEDQSLMKEIGVKAIAEAHSLGLATAHGDDRGLFYRYPDGHREYFELHKKTKVKPNSKTKGENVLPL
ncbi:MAG: hypothetical protein K9K75_04180 [Deltaproteobacteria bacterium]|nr:hypothetical protein [Deltaproteobacteria bacterium]